MENNNLNEEINRIKSLFTEERLYGNLVDKKLIVENAIKTVIRSIAKNGHEAFEAMVKYGGKQGDNLLRGLSGKDLELVINNFNRPLKSIDDMARHFDQYKFFYRGILDDKGYKNLTKYFDHVNQGRYVDPMQVNSAGTPLYAYLPKEMDINAKILANHIDNLPTQQAKLDYIAKVRKSYTEAINDMNKASVDNLKYSDEAGEQVVKQADEAGEQVVKQGDQIDDIGGRTIKELDGKSVPATSKNIDEFGNAIDDLVDQGNVVLTETITHSQKQLDKMIELNNRMVDVIEQQNAARLSGDQLRLKELDVELLKLKIEMKKLETPEGKPKRTITKPSESGGSGGGPGKTPWWKNSKIFNKYMTEKWTRWILNPLAGKGPLKFTEDPLIYKQHYREIGDKMRTWKEMGWGTRNSPWRRPIPVAIVRTWIAYATYGTIYDMTMGDADKYGGSKVTQFLSAWGDRFMQPIWGVGYLFGRGSSETWKAFCLSVRKEVDKSDLPLKEKNKLLCGGMSDEVRRLFGEKLMKKIKSTDCEIFYTKGGNMKTNEDILKEIKEDLPKSTLEKNLESFVQKVGAGLGLGGQLKTIYPEGLDLIWNESFFKDQINDDIDALREKCEEGETINTGTSEVGNTQGEVNIITEELGDTTFYFDPLNQK